MDIFVSFWGTRGSIPTPGFRTSRFGGNTACLELHTNNTLVVCDGGSGMRELGLDMLDRNLDAVTGHLFFSHTHWDHIQGFPFFPPVYDPRNTFYVYTSGPDDRTFELLTGQMKSDYFPVEFSELRARVERRDLDAVGGRVGDFQVDSLALNHPGGATGFRFRCGDVKIVYLSDHELDTLLDNRQQALDSPDLPRQIPQRFLDFAGGADLLVADGQYGDAEYLQRVGWGHSRATTLVDLALQAKVKQLAVTHHDPMQSDEDVDAKIRACRRRAQSLEGGRLVIFGAREGVQLRFETGTFPRSGGDTLERPL
ncbi:MAG: MBL fold metallo-hydrolase [Deltaproteobacteria bacterium]|nr:MAG: MBL fold metallo-hydrolase [Deltaproteobacteria bacterium]